MKGLIYTYFLTYVGAAVSIFYPFVGLLIYINFAIIRPESMWFWSVPYGNYSRIVGVAMLIGWLFRGFGDWRLGKANAVIVLLLTYYFWTVVGWGMADVRPIAFQYIFHTAKIVLPVLVGITMIDSMVRVKALAWALVISLGYLGLEMNFSYYAGINRVAALTFGGLDNNGMAFTFVCGVGLAFFMGLGEKNIWLKLLAFLCAALMVHTIMFSWSRGGMLALIISGCCAVFLVPMKPKYYWAFALALIVGLRLAGPTVRERFVTVFVEKEERDASANSRLEAWKACADSMKKHPVFGVGPNHWPLVAGSYGLGKLEAHSLWMQAGAELGFPGLILLLAFYGSCMMRLWPMAREKIPGVDPWCAHAARGVIASLVGFGIAAQFVSVSGVEVPYYVALLGAALLKVTSVGEPAAARQAVMPRWAVPGRAPAAQTPRTGHAPPTAT